MEAGMVFMGSMSRVNRSRLAWFAALVAVAALIAWLLWPRDESPDAAPRRAMPVVADAKARADRRRDVAATSTNAPGAEEAAARPEVSSARRLTVIVLRADGVAAVGASVRIDSAPDPVIRADERGRAAVPVPDGDVFVLAWTKDEAGRGHASCDGTSAATLTVRLGSSVPVRGRVVEVGGRPIAGAEVHAFVQGFYGVAGHMLDMQTTSAADGSFEMPSLPKDGVDASTVGVYVEASAAGFPKDGVVLKSAELAHSDVVVELAKPAVLSGRFLDAAGAPVAGEIVSTATAGQGETQSGADGRFELTLPRRPSVQIVALPRRLRRSWKPDDPPGWGAARSLGPVRGDAGDKDLGDIVLAEGASVEGVVVDAAGRPIVGCIVCVHLEGEYLASTTTDAAGRFTLIHVGDQPHAVTAVADDGSKGSGAGRSAAVVGVRGGAAPLRIVVNGAGTALLRFVDAATRAPITTKRADLEFGEPGVEGLSSYGWTGSEMDAVRFEPKRAGRFDLTLEIEDFEPVHVGVIEVFADRETVVDVQFRRKAK
jgi:hypothetical protein